MNDDLMGLECEKWEGHIREVGVAHMLTISWQMCCKLNTPVYLVPAYTPGCLQRYRLQVNTELYKTSSVLYDYIKHLFKYYQMIISLKKCVFPFCLQVVFGAAIKGSMTSLKTG